MDVADLRTAALAAASTSVTGTAFLQYVTRWQMGNVIYYALAEAPVGGGQPQAFQFYAGAAQSIDLCSVSACDPHVLYYPDAPAFNGSGTQTGGFAVPGRVKPAKGIITIHVPVGDIGSPAKTSLLEEAGTYAFGSAHMQSAVTNAMAELDQLPLEVDGTCCFNYQLHPAAAQQGVPSVPVSLGLAGVMMVGGGLLRRRRRPGLLAT